MVKLADTERVWNRWFVVTPALSFMLGNIFDKQNTCYAHLIVLEKLMGRISPASEWKERLKLLLEKHHAFPIFEMGFSQNWKNDDFWSITETKPVSRRIFTLETIV